MRVFENKVLRTGRGCMGLGGYGVTWRLHNEGLNDLYSSLNIMWWIKSRRMQWMRACVGQGEVHRGFW